MRIGILTLSDKGARGEREDLSGPLIRELLSPLGAETIHYEVIPDDRALLSRHLITLSDKLDLDVVLTTGGTGLSPRDVTPEATKAVIDYEVPGMAEAMRAHGLTKTPNAMLSRAVVGVRGKTLIINLPGSPKAVRENLEVILPALPHAVGILRGHLNECATEPRNK